MRIGEAARQAALSVDAIRFYERRALLPEAPRTAGRFRLYSQKDVARLRFIRRAQAMGFALREIQPLLELRERDAGVCAPVRELLRAKLAEVRARRRQLQALESELGAALRRCERELRVTPRSRAAVCPVLARAGKEQARKGRQ